MKTWITGLTVVALVAAVWWGIALVDPARDLSRCAGDIVDTVTCEGAMGRSAIFGSVLVGAALVSGSILGAALLLRARRPAHERGPDAGVPLNASNSPQATQPEVGNA